MTQTTPQPSIRTTCPHCQKLSTRESGGTYQRRHRDLNGIQTITVKRFRCSHCQKALPSQYPPGVHRYKWYSERVQAIFAVLHVHQVQQACQTEIANIFNYAIVPDTRDEWQDTRAVRANRQHQEELEQIKASQFEIKCGSIDEFKLGFGWAYTLTDTASQAVLGFKTNDTRAETTVRDVISILPPKAIISDGCPMIQAGAAWWADIPHGRCWFHVMQAMSKLAAKEPDAAGVSERQRLTWRVQFLLSQPSITDAEAYLKILRGLHSPEVLEPLNSAWSQLRLRWLLGLPVTNNTSETLFNAVWARTRKRVVKITERAEAWLAEALWRWNHHLVRGLSPWARLTGRSSGGWLQALVVPLGRRAGSTHF